MKVNYPLSKEWFLIFFQNHNKELKLEPIFWLNIKNLIELGFKEFYFLVTKEEEKAKEYFEEKLKGKNANIQILDKENISKKVRTDGVNIYVFKQKERGIANALVEIKEAINGRPFLEIFGDEYFDGEKETVKRELKNFVNFAIEKIKYYNALKVEAFVKKENAISNISEAERRYCIRENGQLDIVEDSNIIVTSLSLSSPAIIDLFEEKGIRDFNNFETQKELIETGRIYGKVIDLNFANINTKEDYLAVMLYTLHTIIKNTNNKLLKIR
jgi:NDP-sugar pyrophosphorylase family protein